MKFILSICAIGISFLISYLRCEGLRRAEEITEFMHKFCDKMIKNNYSEMLPIHELFSQTYNEAFNTQISLKSTSETLEFIQNLLDCVPDNEHLIELITNFNKAGASEISNVEGELLKATSESISIAKKHYTDRGKTSFIIYPSLTALAVLILI